MAQEQYTSGPWETSGYAIMADGSLVAHVVRDMGVDVEGRANASLIAASPEMFEALEIIVRHWTRYLAEDELPDWPADPVAVMNDAWKDGFLEKAEAALAKASPSTRRDGPVLREGVAS